MSIDTSKIIHGVVGGGRYTVTSPIVKEDYGLYLLIEGLELPSTYEVDFSNTEHNGSSVTMIGNADGVLIPSQFISSGKDVFAFLYHVGVDYGRTVYKFRIPNKLRPDRTDEQPTPEEQSVIDQAISALNSAVEQTAQDVIDADASAQSASESAEQAQESARTAGLYSDTAQTYANSAEISANSASASATASAQSAEQAQASEQGCARAVQDAVEAAAISRARAEDSATSASQASGYAQSAGASAQSASGYASSAQTSAQTASTKATEASQSASTASQKASEASQSASQALTYKTDAESAKTASQTAQGLAESARDSAISAQESAEDARDEAQNIVDGISGKVEQIDSNTERIESLEDDRYKPYPTDTASGAVASFSDGADDIPLKSLIVSIDPVQDTSSGDPSPENICPISGWTGANISASGKNLFDEPTAIIYPRYFRLASSETNIWEPDSNSTSFAFRCKPNTTYTVSCDNANITIFRIGWIAENPDALTGNPVINDAIRKTASGASTITTGANSKAIVIQLNRTVGIAKTSKTQIELGSTATEYEPYKGRSIPISWQTEAGTVYGGSLDVVSGVLRVEMAMADLGALSWLYSSGTQRMYSTSLMSAIKKPASDAVTANALCSIYDTASANATSTHVKDKIIAIGSTGIINVYDTDYVGVAPSEFKTAMDGVQLCYELAEPIEIQLSANQINSLYGVNNLWADTGDSSVEYRADTKLYIEKLTQPEEDDMIADSAITSGQFFMIGNSLYRALANIASGATITIGTNAQRVSLADALNLINT